MLPFPTQTHHSQFSEIYVRLAIFPGCLSFVILLFDFLLLLLLLHFLTTSDACVSLLSVREYVRELAYYILRVSFPSCGRWENETFALTNTKIARMDGWMDGFVYVCYGTVSHDLLLAQNNVPKTQSMGPTIPSALRVS